MQPLGGGVTPAFFPNSNTRCCGVIAHAPATTATADGEPFTGMLARVQSLIADLKLSSPQTVLVVTHGWTLQAVRVILDEISPDDAARCVDMPSNCEIVEGRF